MVVERKVAICNISLVDSIEYNKIVNLWNTTKKIYPKHKNIHILFEENVKKNPDKIAIIYNDSTLTYKELNEKSNKLANYLINNYDLSESKFIALCLEKSDLMIISILAILKAGCVYVPISPEFPSKRIEYIIKDTKSLIILTTDEWVKKLAIIEGDFFIEIVSKYNIENKYSLYSNQTPQINIESNYLAYVIYTSGTTNKPKGVLVEHKSVINFIYSLRSIYELKEDEVVLFFSNFIFDASIEHIFIALLHGYKLVLISNDGWKTNRILFKF